MKQPCETTRLHTRLLRCGLAVDDSRAYWQHAAGTTRVSAHQAFDEYWFGNRSLGRIAILLSNLRARFDAFPAALSLLHRWPDMTPETRRLICHWHLQLSDRLYRDFTGKYLLGRRASPCPEVSRALVVAWVDQQALGRWAPSTRIQFASNLLASARAAGLVATIRDPRPLVLPRVGESALEYLMYLLRGVGFKGSLLDNPYLASVGLVSARVEDRLRGSPGVDLLRQGRLLDFRWQFPDLASWAAANGRNPVETGATP